MIQLARKTQNLRSCLESCLSQSTDHPSDYDPDEVDPNAAIKKKLSEAAADILSLAEAALNREKFEALPLDKLEIENFRQHLSDDPERRDYYRLTDAYKDVAIYLNLYEKSLQA